MKTLSQIALSTITMSLAIVLLGLAGACSPRTGPSATLLIYGGPIYTVDSLNPNVEAVAVNGTTILYAGSLTEAGKFKTDSTRILDLKGRMMAPGFIEGHGHFMGLGQSKLILDLSGATDYQDLIDAVAEKAKSVTPGEWIIGRGWHQSKWAQMPADTVKGFQTHARLSAVSPDNPVYLAHASGHAALANAKAMDAAGIPAGLPKEGMDALEVDGGEIIRDATGGPTGIFTENAMGLITKAIPETTSADLAKAFTLAQEACHQNGITSFHDAGIGSETLGLYEKMKADGKMAVRIYAMLGGGDRNLLKEWYNRGPMVDPDHRLTVRSIKLVADGALGSRGAWLLEPYTDRPGFYGAPTIPMDSVERIGVEGLDHGFQVCTHAIGDRANREVLDRYEKAFSARPEKTDDHRFRIEHAQHLDPEDIPRFAQLQVIPAMQAIHLSSDRPWAIDRLGKQRITEGAYMWQALLATGVPIVNGTDVPVEPIDPIANFYASVTRKTLAGTPPEGYEPAQRMTREQALRSYTLDAAYGAFEEHLKGSITAGKLADFTVFSQNIMTVSEPELLETRVAMTIFDGHVVYQSPE